MNANVKIVLVLGAIVLAVFGITVISNYTSRAEADKVKSSEVVGDSANGSSTRSIIRSAYGPAIWQAATRRNALASNVQRCH